MPFNKKRIKADPNGTTANAKLTPLAVRIATTPPSLSGRSEGKRRRRQFVAGLEAGLNALKHLRRVVFLG